MKDSHIFVTVNTGAQTTLSIVDAKSGAPLGRLSFPTESAGLIARALETAVKTAPVPAKEVDAEPEPDAAPKKKRAARKAGK